MNQAPSPQATPPFASRSASAERLRLRLQRDLERLRRAWKHPCTPWHVRLLCGLLLAYALSPIDLIPDFIPILGHLDDLVILPLGLALCLYLLPKELKEDESA
jgi:uncharacterized membrane protein YkvA (DUF1232 family)